MDETLRTLSETTKARSKDIVHFLEELVAIPTPNPPGENYERIVGLLFSRLQGVGVEMKTIYIPCQALAPFNIDGERYPRLALVGRLGDSEDRSLHLHGHFDVVPANRPGQYQPTTTDGRIYGRGTADMKGGLAAIWGAFLILSECGLQPGRKITLSITPDEESGGETGAAYLLREGLLNAQDMAFLIMPECTSGEIWNASKGALVIDVVIEGQAAHSSLPPLGRNAFEDMLPVAEALLSLKERIETRRSPLPVEDPRAAFSTMTIGGEGGGGEKFNIVPGRYHFTVDRRPIPEETLEEVREELFAVQEQMRSRGIELTFYTWLEAHPSHTNADEPGCRILSQALQQVRGHPPRFLLCPGFLDIRHFNARGVPAVACGPGQLQVAHGPEEWVAEKDLLEYVQVLALTMLRF